MASLDSLPADQRAVLQLVLQRGRSYDDIARLLSIDRAAVRQRALSAFDALGPQTSVPDQRRALITDYLLGQLPERVRDQTRDRLAESPSERAWARVLASELTPLASQPLPEIPVEGARSRPAPPPPPAADDDDGPIVAQPPAARRPRAPRPPAQPRAARPARAARAAAEPASGLGGREADDDSGRPPRRRSSPGPSSRRGGVMLLAGGALVVVVVIIVIVAGSGGGSKPKPAASSTSSTTTAAASASSTTSASSTSSTAAHVIAQINLAPPAAGSKAAGIAEVLKEGANDGIAIVAQNVTPNTTTPPNAYAVWLYNSPTDAHILGFVNPGVSTNGRLSTAGGLPANAKHYKELIVTVETSGSPKTPGTIILQGALSGL